MSNMPISDLLPLPASLPSSSSFCSLGFALAFSAFLVFRVVGIFSAVTHFQIVHVINTLLTIVQEIYFCGVWRGWKIQFLSKE